MSPRASSSSSRGGQHAASSTAPSSEDVPELEAIDDLTPEDVAAPPAHPLCQPSHDAIEHRIRRLESYARALEERVQQLEGHT